MNAKTENRKALPKFILFMVCCLLLGGALGALIVFAEGDWTAVFTQGLRHVLSVSAPWLLTATALVSSLGVHLLYRKARSDFANLTVPDDEETLDRVDHTLEIALLINNICSIAAYFFFAAALCGLRELNIYLAILSLAAFLWNIVSMLVGQQKLVDLCKQLYPEKRGSVYDTKFAEKWYDSCDEAERAQICQASYTAYKATNLTCVLLWLVLVLSSWLFDTGLLPVAVVTVIWLVSTLSYSVKSMQLGKRKQER